MIHYSCCSYLCAWLRLMWWNPHGEMMCSAEGWQSRGGGLSMFVEPRTCSGPVLLSVSTATVQTHCVLIIYRSFFLSLLLAGDLCSCSCLSLYSFHVSYHTFDPCLRFAGAWKSTTMSCRASGWNVAKRRKNWTILALIWTSLSPDIHSIAWRIFWDQCLFLAQS